MIFAGLVALGIVFIESLEGTTSQDGGAGSSGEGDVMHVRIGAAPEGADDR